MNLSSYLQNVAGEDPPSVEEELSLLSTIRDTSLPPRRREIAKDRFIRKYIMFVVKKAKDRSAGFTACTTAFEDMIAAGNVGLMIALNKFDETKGVRFLTYAGWWVDQCQRRAQQEMRLVSLPVWQQQLSARIRKLEQSNPGITSEEIKRDHAPDTSLSIINSLRSTQYLTFFLDDILSNMMGSGSKDHDADSIDKAVQKASSSIPQMLCGDFADDVLADRDAARLLTDMKEMLTAREYQVVCSLLEIGSYDRKSIKQLAAEMEVAVSEVRRLKDRAMEKLRKYYLKKGHVPPATCTEQAAGDV